MSAKVNPNPYIASDPSLVYTSLFDTLYTFATRINTSLQADGSEAATAPVLLASYTVATLPTASKYTGGLIYVSNGTANKRLAISDGTNWRFPDGNIVS
jgi:hypothetical protein